MYHELHTGIEIGNATTLNSRVAADENRKSIEWTGRIGFSGPWDYFEVEELATGMRLTAESVGGS